MAEQNPPMQGVTAHVTIPDGRALEAIEFYRAAFGAEMPMEAKLGDDSGLVLHAHLVINGGPFMLNDHFPDFMGEQARPAAFALHLEFPDADAAWKRALDAGASEHYPLADQFWGARYGQVKDPFGIIWSISGPLEG